MSKARLKPVSNLVQSRKILVVEDEAGIRQAYSAILAPAKKADAIKSSRQLTKAKKASAETEFEVVIVPTGEEAVELVKQSLGENKPFALGFFDVLLGGGIDGIETVRQIHALDHDLYAVLVTAYQDRHVDSIQEVFGTDFSDRWDYLNKPFSEGEILQKARSFVSMWNLRKREGIQRQILEQANQRARESERLLSVATVARGVGHEFGNLLQQIVGQVDLALNGSPEEMREALKAILKAASRSDLILDRFKNLARPAEESTDEAVFSVIDPINETLLLIKHELKRSNIKVTVDGKDLPHIFGSPSRLGQVFMNMMLNAIYAMKDKDASQRLIEVHCKQRKKGVEVRIRDHGTGIPEEYIGSIFNAFFTTKGTKGTGIGLAICKEIIEGSFGGALSVSNHPNGGAEFCIEIPEAEESHGSKAS